MTAPTRAPYRPRHAGAAPAPAPKPAARPERAPLRVVAPGELSPRGRRRRNRLVAAGVCLVACLGLFGVVAFHVLLTQGQLELDRLSDRAEDAQARYDRNRLLMAELEAPERIVAVAQERLGMVPPPDVVYLSPSGVQAPRPAAPQGDGGGRAADDTTAPSWPSVKAHLAAGR